jgi:hypothetical protein
LDSFVSSTDFKAFKLQTNERFDRIENKMEAILNLISERLPIALTPPSSSPSVIKSSASDSPLLPVVNEITFEPIIPSL